jgi:hypothetical protein
MDEQYLTSLLKDGQGVLVDIKGTYRTKIKNLHYWSL